MGNALITRRGVPSLSNINFIPATVFNTKDKIATLTLDRDYDILIFTNAFSSARDQGGAGIFKIDGYTALKTVDNGNYGFNQNLGHDNDQGSRITIFTNVKAGAVISITGFDGTYFKTSICIGLYKEKK